MTTISQTRDELARPRWLPTDQWPFAIRRHAHRNERGELVDIHYTDEGDGPTLVFVHAGMWSYIWRDAITTLSAGFRCITLDFPGTGLSGGDRHDIDIDTYPAILNAVLDERGVERATFVVHDLGGVVGVLAAARRPGRITGLVAANSFSWVADGLALRAMFRFVSSRPTTVVLGTFRVIPRSTRTRMGVGRHLDNNGRAAFFGPYQQRTASRNFHRVMRSARHSPESFEQAERALAGPLSQLPVLTIFGEKNDPFGFADRWKTLFPTAHGWTVTGGNHFPMCDDPIGFAHHITDWHHTEIPT
ncbi:MAG: alpha/beta fold hydrolase [Ilumatobacter sp.]|uniref:alpha/beta fold hydrolase n=1 Tax=Ilumatobacter sp. TaxID=1967498 RepID=UPI003918E22F